MMVFLKAVGLTLILLGALVKNVSSNDLGFGKELVDAVKESKNENGRSDMSYRLKRVGSVMANEQEVEEQASLNARSVRSHKIKSKKRKRRKKVSKGQVKRKKVKRKKVKRKKSTLKRKKTSQRRNKPQKKKKRRKKQTKRKKLRTKDKDYYLNEGRNTIEGCIFMAREAMWWEANKFRNIRQQLDRIDKKSKIVVNKLRQKDVFSMTQSYVEIAMADRSDPHCQNVTATAQALADIVKLYSSISGCSSNISTSCQAEWPDWFFLKTKIEDLVSYNPNCFGLFL